MAEPSRGAHACRPRRCDLAALSGPTLCLARMTAERRKTGRVGPAMQWFLRSAGITRRNAIFMAHSDHIRIVVFAKPHDDRVIAIWLLSFIIWAAIIRWWMVAGALGGLLFYQPHLHDFDITGRILNVAFGAIMVGICAEAFKSLFGKSWLAPAKPNSHANRETRVSRRGYLPLARCQPAAAMIQGTDSQSTARFILSLMELSLSRASSCGPRGPFDPSVPLCHRASLKERSRLGRSEKGVEKGVGTFCGQPRGRRAVSSAEKVPDTFSDLSGLFGHLFDLSRSAG